MATFEFIESEHPRAAKGQPTGGQFVSKQAPKLRGAWKLDDDDRVEISKYKNPIQVLTKPLTREQRGAVVDYTGIGYHINKDLRTGKELEQADEIKLVDNLSAAINSSRLDTDTTLYRIVHRDFAQRLDLLEPGEKVVDNGFMSTTTDKSAWSPQPRETLVILAAKGSKALVVGGLGISGDTSCTDHEIAKRVRDLAGLNPPGGKTVDDISYSSVDGPSAFTHPLCLNTYRNGAFIGNEAPANGY